MFWNPMWGFNPYWNWGWGGGFGFGGAAFPFLFGFLLGDLFW